MITYMSTPNPHIRPTDEMDIHAPDARSAIFSFVAHVFSTEPTVHAFATDR